MAQLTIRCDDELKAVVTDAAARQNRSVNEYVCWLIRAANDPESADSERARVRERLARAGILVEVSPLAAARPSAASVAAAGKRAAKGRLASDLVSEGRD
jgi:hypothetical protein